MFSSYFLRFNDNFVKEGQWITCGPKCTRHQFTMRSRVSQKVYIAVSVHPMRSYTDFECSGAYTTVKAAHSAKVENRSNIETFDSGTKQFQPISVEAGELLTITTEFDWTRPDITKDFSVTIWSDQDPVILVHNHGLTSRTWPTLG